MFYFFFSLILLLLLVVSLFHSPHYKQSVISQQSAFIIYLTVSLFSYFLLKRLMCFVCDEKEIIEHCNFFFPKDDEIQKKYQQKLNIVHLISNIKTGISNTYDSSRDESMSSSWRVSLLGEGK